jgi:alanyl-tRNA synthetase
MQNHTSTHILNWALREVLEIESKDPTNKVDQKGSLVDPEKTRFDFSHPKPLNDEELAAIEKLCNEKIDAALPIYAATREEDFVDQKKAREINTLRAVFGEKYPNRVRVVSIGAPIDEMLRDPKNPKWMQYSVEFCGGTHVKNTSECKRFVLTHEEGVAKGIRRVVGISGEKAIEAVETAARLLAELDVLSAASRDQNRDRQGADSTIDNRQSPIDNLPSAIADFQQRLSAAEIPILARRKIHERLADLQKIAREHERQSAAASGDVVMDRVKELLGSAQEINGVTVLVAEVPEAPADALRGAIDWVRNKTKASAVLLATASDNKVTLVAGMSKAVVDKGVRAGDLIKEIAPLVGGKGGGRPDMAQGGGTDPSGMPRAIQRAREWLTVRLK